LRLSKNFATGQRRIWRTLQIALSVCVPLPAADRDTVPGTGTSAASRETAAATGATCRNGCKGCCGSLRLFEVPRCHNVTRWSPVFILAPLDPGVYRHSRGTNYRGPKGRGRVRF